MPPDVVFIVSEHVRRPELQYALRSWDLVPHGAVWFIGGRPGWVRNVNHIPFPDHENKWKNISDKARSLASLDGPAEEFYYTEDDYFILKPVDRIPDYIRDKSLNDYVGQQEKKRKRGLRGGWWGYMQNTRDVLHENGISEPASFDVHIPMLWRKSEMPVHWETPGPVSWRSLIGNTRTSERVLIEDIKVSASRNMERIDIGFASSSDGTFRKILEPTMAGLFPDPCRYEQEYYMDAPYDQEPRRLDAKKQRIVARRVRRNKPDQIVYEDGTREDVSDMCDCGFVAKSAGGLTTHQRSHTKEE